jgi:dissimilatory sulfite reductase related protein
MDVQASIAHHARSTVAPTWLDEDGFLAESDHWSPSLAEQLAREAGISRLSAKQWEVIRFVRERYFSIGALPVMRLVCRAVGVDASSGHRLFSSCRVLWLIAGLPNPGEEAKSYMN